jgi:phospholipid/cholesterol/gamma-HCH transport system substrate-binding protein
VGEMKEKQIESSRVDLPKRTFTTEFWVGVFALLGCLSFAYLSINLANMKLTNAGYYQVQAEFANISGLKVGAPVEIAGVQVGEISDISLKNTDAVVTLQIKNGVKLRDDDIAQVRTKGIIGDKYLKISPGGSQENIPAGGELSETESSVEFEDVLGKLIHKMESK